MVLTLNSRFPLVWRTPSSLQFGVDNPVVVLTEVTVATERMLAALAVGISEPGLIMIGRTAGAEVAEIHALIAALAPALATGQNVDNLPTVLLVGTGLTGPSLMLDKLATVLAASNIQVRIAADPATVMAHETDTATGATTGAATGTGTGTGTASTVATHCDLAIAISHYVLAPALRGVWLRRDIPHLTVNFSDTRIELGPFIEPGLGPCLYCIERHRTDADASWPAIVTQLWGRHSALESAAIVGEVGAIVARLAIRRLAQGPDKRSHSTLEVDALSGERFEREWTTHPECGCTGLVA